MYKKTHLLKSRETSYKPLTFKTVYKYMLFVIVCGMDIIIVHITFYGLCFIYIENHLICLFYFSC